MFFFKKKKIIVDAFTWNSSIEEYFKPASTVNFIPDWWKQVPSSYKKTNTFGVTVDNPTIKRCDGFLHLYRKGFVIPLWSDLIMEMRGDGTWAYVWSDPDGTNIIDHETPQFGNMMPHLIHVKITSPWILKEKSGVEFYWTEPIWNNLTNYNNVTTLPGVINFKYQGSSHINMFFENKKQRYEFKHGHPMAQIIPLSDNDVEVKTHLISLEEWKTMRHKDVHRFSFLNYYKNKVKMAESSEQKKCPFGFGKK